MSEFIVDPEDWPIEEIIKDQAYFDAAIRFVDEQGYSDLADAVHGLKARLQLRDTVNDVLRQRIKELERQNELLRAVAKQTEPLFNMSAGFSGGRQEVHDAVVALNKKYQAAIDGGALDKDGEK